MNRRTLLAAGAGLATLRPVRAEGVTRTVAGAKITLEIDGTGPDGFTERVWRWVGSAPSVSAAAQLVPSSPRVR